jgi:hypothetical protein
MAIKLETDRKNIDRIETKEKIYSTESKKLNKSISTLMNAKESQTSDHFQS